jgi:hypothetical protein
LDREDDTISTNLKAVFKGSIKVKTCATEACFITKIKMCRHITPNTNDRTSLGFCGNTAYYICAQIRNNPIVRSTNATIIGN